MFEVDNKRLIRRYIEEVINTGDVERLPEFIREKTLFVVTHRLSTIAECDRILLLNENQLVDSGTHNTLLESNKYYREMMALQRVKETNFIEAGIMD